MSESTTAMDRESRAGRGTPPHPGGAAPMVSLGLLVASQRGVIVGSRGRPLWRDLTAALEGEVVLPGSRAIRRGAAGRRSRASTTCSPQAVVLCRTPEDVVEAIAFARRSGAGDPWIRSGGRRPAGRWSGPGMVLDLTPMRSLEVSDGLATVGPGFRLGDLYAALAQHGSHGIPGRLRRRGRDRRPGARRRALACWAAVAGPDAAWGGRWSRQRWVLADGRVVKCDEQRHEGTCSGRCAARAPRASAWSRASRSARCPSPRPPRSHLKWPYERASALMARPGRAGRRRGPGRARGEPALSPSAGRPAPTRWSTCSAR